MYSMQPRSGGNNLGRGQYRWWLSLSLPVSCDGLGKRNTPYRKSSKRPCTGFTPSPRTGPGGAENSDLTALKQQDIEAGDMPVETLRAYARSFAEGGCGRGRSPGRMR